MSPPPLSHATDGLTELSSFSLPERNKSPGSDEGLPRAEAFVKIRLDRINLDRATIYLPETKTGEVRTGICRRC
jgi:hypothetical protein